jgi:hypothetical protein
MPTADDWVQDVMQVCRNGHVITDLLRSSPERGLAHCDRCGAGTLERCPTCGQELPGAVGVPGLRPLGARRPPLYCSTCGAAFPWAERPRPAGPEPLARLEALLGRVPLVVRQLRRRQGERPPFRVEDERDLEDLLRALLPLLADDVRPQGRTPRYAAGTRTDFLLAAEGIVVVAKVARGEVREAQLAAQIAEDAGHYRGQKGVRTLVGFVYNPEGLVRDGAALTAGCAGEGLEVRCVVGGA